MELFTATGKVKKFFLRLEMFDVCTMGDTAHIDTISMCAVSTAVHTSNISSRKKKIFLCL